ncbi:MAG: endonuclease/exonuclease/phosphatase family protein [Desulfarculus sp.]|nr:endonuclease/exonuclease/phosphatase family protein [Desulfarculus sp.]
MAKPVKKGKSVYQKPDNDKLSDLFINNGLVPEELRGTDRFLDVVCWNIRYFHDRDPRRVANIVEVLGELNADVLVLEEILEGSLDVVARSLGEQGAGYYQVAYGTTGGNQRIAIMYDLDWVRAKDDIVELFGKGQVVTGGGKEVFPRLPLWAHFTSLTNNRQSEPFDFQLVGVHLKSQRGGGEDQRRAAGQRLAKWLGEEAEIKDADVIILGDWNEPPGAPCWQALHQLEKQGRVGFAKINDSSNISHLMYRNKNEIGSRLDLGAISVAALDNVQAPPTAIHWKPLSKMLAGNPQGRKIKDLLKQISNEVSDHMPVVSRFYFTEDD